MAMFAVSASFASEDMEDLQAEDDIGMEPIAVSDESMDDSSQVDESLSAGVSGVDSDNISSADGSEAVLSEEEGTFAQINESVNSNTEVVDLYGNYTKEPEFGYDGIVINKEITIDGHGAVLDADNFGAIFVVKTTSKVVFKDLTFKQATDSAIRFEKDATVDFINCTFIDNRQENTVRYSDAYGGAIDFQKGLYNSSFIDSKFYNNAVFCWGMDSNVMGGAIAVRGVSRNNVFENVFFSGNYVSDLDEGSVVYSGKYQAVGGGIAFLGENYNNNFTRAVFVGNSVAHRDYFYYSSYQHSYGNYAAAIKGGAIYYGENAENINFMECTFDGNLAASGGAIHFWKDAVNVTFDDSKFIGNDISRGDTDKPNSQQYDFQREGMGGALYFTNACDVTLSNLVFDENEGRSGGCVYIENGDRVTFTNINFTDNLVFSDWVNSYTTSYNSATFIGRLPQGGAIYLNHVRSSVLDNILFKNNVAKTDKSYTEYFHGISAGAIYAYDVSDITIKNTVFDGNTAENYAGAFYGNSLKNVRFENVNFTNNLVSSDEGVQGGAVYLSSSDCDNVTFADVNFISNGVYTDFKYHTSSSASNSALGGVARITGSNICFSNVNFTDNSMTLAGTIKSSEYCMGMVYLVAANNVSFDDVNFVGNKIDSPVAAYVGGSAVATYADVSNVTFNNVLFESNPSSGKGAVYIRGKSGYAFNNVRFINNTAGEAAAIYATAADVSISNVVFEDNTVSGNGNIIYISGNNFTMSNANFTNNKLNTSQSNYGGVIYLSVRNSTVSDVNIIGNTEQGDYAEAAAIYSTKSTSVSFTNINVINNTAYKTGVFVFNTPKDVNVSHVIFSGNAVGSGSSAVIYTDAPINIDHCDFMENSVRYADIYHYNTRLATSYMNVSSCNFKGQSKNYVINARYVPLNVTDCEFPNHVGDSVIYLYNSPNSMITDANFTDNSCRNGAVYIYNYAGSPAVMENVRFINNTASEKGGAIYSYSGGLNLTDVYFDNNRAYSNGGTIYMDYSSRAFIDNVTIKNSVSYGSGGAIYSYSSAYVLNISNSIFDNCTAYENGGAIYKYDTYEGKDMINVTFTNNRAYAGGAIYLTSYASLNINQSTFINNTAEGTGGAIYASNGAEVSIDNANFTKNNASCGSAIDNYGTLTISNSAFFKNKANSTSLIVTFDRNAEETNITYTGGDNYINAIQSASEITFSNVEYFEYEGSTIFNTDSRPAVDSYEKANQTFIVEFIDENNVTLASYTFTSDMNGKLEIGPEFVPEGRHHVSVTRLEDDYYTAISSTALCIWGDFTILQRLIDALDDNGVLTLNRTYIYTIGADDITEGIIINKTNITINGNGFKINALFQSRIFQVLTSDVKFYNIHFVNATGWDGAFIYGIDVNNTEIINCSFENTIGFAIEDYQVYPVFGGSDGPIVEPDPWGGEIGRGGNTRGGYDYYVDPEPVDYGDFEVGGAVYIVGNNLDVINSNFTNIIAHMGGSVYFEGDNATFINSRFNNTKGGYGGALCLLANNVLIDYCSFYNNTAQLAGGAILALGNNYTVDNSNFTLCHIIEDDIGGTWDLDDFIRSLAEQFIEEPEIPGGDPVDPIPVDPGTTKAPRRDDIILFDEEDNEPEHRMTLGDYYIGGGAIYSVATNISISKSSFDTCYANSFGGAVFANGVNTEIDGCDFVSCNATSGGALLIALTANDTIVNNCLFESNVALRNGGAISWYGPNGTLTASTFNNNIQYLVDIYSEYPNENANSPMNGGGAVYWYGINATVDNCNFTNNRVCIPYGDYINEIMNMDLSDEDKARMIYRLLGNYWPSEVSLDENEIMYQLLYMVSDTGSYGGAFLIRGYYINITNCNFNDNFAQTGGAIAVANPNYGALNMYTIPPEDDIPLDEYVMSNINIDSCRFVNNFAQYAGAVSIYGYRVNVYNSRFDNNTAYVAGALALQGIESLISNATFADNHAYVAGAVLSGCYVYDGWSGISEISGFNNTIDNSTFINNGAEGAGAVLWLDENGVINDCYFKQNNAMNTYAIYAQRFNDCYKMQIDEGRFMDLEFIFSNNMGVNMQMPIMNNAGAVFWAGNNGLINDTEFVQSNATIGGAVYWVGMGGTVNNSRFVENTAIRGNALLWDGDWGVVDNTAFIGNKGFEVESENSAAFGIYNYSVFERRSEYYYYTYDYDQIGKDKFYNELLPELRSMYGYNINLIYNYYSKIYDGYRNSYRYYNVTFYYIFSVSDYGSMGSAMSQGAVYWMGYDGLINNSNFMDNENYHAGALYVSGGNLQLANSNFTHNSAHYAGAVGWEGEAGSIYNSIFKDNFVFDDYETATCYNYLYLDRSSSFVYAGNYYDIGTSDEIHGELYDFICDIAYEYNTTDIEIQSYGYSYDDNGNGTYNVTVHYIFLLKMPVETSFLTRGVGGAVIWATEDAIISTSQFINNTAACGAAVYIFGENGWIYDSKFIENHAVDFSEPNIVDRQRYVAYEIEADAEGYVSDADPDRIVNERLMSVLDEIYKMYDCDTVLYEGCYYDTFDIEDPEEEYGSYRYKLRIGLVFSLIDHVVEYCPVASLGAGVYAEGYNTVIESSYFANNSASAGAAVYANQMTVIYNSTFEDNTAYKSTTIEPADDVQVINQIITYYRDYWDTGAEKEVRSDVYKYILSLYDEYDADEIRVEYKINGYIYSGDMMGYYLESIEYNITLINYANKTTIGSFGGAVYVNAPETLITEGEFNNNYAEYGGAVYIAEQTEIEDVMFNSNSAEYGGAVYVKSVDVNMVASTFELNHGFIGGAVYWESENGTVSESRFFNNTAHNAGAIYFLGDNQRILDGSLFQYNKADTGSALYVVGKGLEIHDSALLENQAKSASIVFVKEVVENTLTVHIIFRGNDNFINAMYIENECILDNVVYCPVESENSPNITTLEDGIAIDIKLSDSDSILSTIYNLTDINGETVIVAENLKPGRYLLTVEHEEDNYYTQLTKTEIIQVGPGSTPMEVVAEDIFYKQNATIEVRVPIGVTGECVINIDGTNYTTVNISRYVAQVTVPNLEGGLHSVIAYYLGNNMYGANSTNTTFTVKPIPTTVIVSSDGGDYGTDIPVSVVLGDEDVTGKVLLTIEDIYGVTLFIGNSNELSTVINGLDAGTYNITAFYTGDNNYLNATNSTVFNVTPVHINAIVLAYNVSYIENSKFIITVPTEFVGKVNITVGDVAGVYDMSGSKVITFEKLTAGDKTANLSFYGNKNFIDESVLVNFTVTRPEFEEEVFTVHSYNMTRSANSPYDYQAEFLDENGEVLANAPVAFIVNGVRYNATTNKDGIAQLSANLAPGEYDVTCVNLATGHNSTMQLNIVGRIYENKDQVMDFRSGSSVVVRVVGDDGKTAPEGEIVSMTINGVSYVAKVDSKGYAKLKINLNPKTYKVTVEYKGFKTTNKVIVKQTLKLVKKTTTIKKTAKSLVLKATLKWSSGKAIAGKKLIFKFYGKSYAVKTDKNGLAKVTISQKIIKKLQKGKSYAFSVKYYTNYVKGSVKVSK